MNALDFGQSGQFVSLTAPPFKVDKKTGHALLDKIALDFSYVIDTRSSNIYPEITPMPFTYDYGEGYDSIIEAFEDKLLPIRPRDTIQILDKRISSDAGVGASSIFSLDNEKSIIAWSNLRKGGNIKENFWTLMYSYPYTSPSGESVTKYIVHPQINILAYWAPV